MVLKGGVSNDGFRLAQYGYKCMHVHISGKSTITYYSTKQVLSSGIIGRVPAERLKPDLTFSHLTKMIHSTLACTNLEDNLKR